MNGDGVKKANWEEIRGRLKGARYDVWMGLLRHGPCTTRGLADWVGMDLLTVRPRVTELCEMCLARCIRRDGHDGVYEGVPMAEAEAAWNVCERHASQLMIGGL